MINRHTSRRSFLKSTAIAGIASALPIDRVLASETNNYFSRTLKDGRDLVFLFQGDSITDGNRGRSKDPNHILGHGYQSIVSTKIGTDFATSNLSFYNRGISGNRVTSLKARWQADTLDLKPDVLSILIGINDASGIINRPSQAEIDKGLEDYETTYRDILNQSKQQNPNTLFVLCLPFVHPVAKTKDVIAKYTAVVDKQVLSIKKLALEFNAVVVDFPAVFEKAQKVAPIEYWNWDGIHPTVFGHELMAREWIKAVSSRLKFLKKYK